MNKTLIMGRFTKDLEIRTATSGGSVLKFTLAVDRSFKKEGEEKQADFISCVAFGKTADNMAKFFSKGRMVIIAGRIQTGKYEKEGQTVYTTDVICDEFFFVDSKKSENNDTPSDTNNGAGFFPIDDGTDELPF